MRSNFDPPPDGTGAPQGASGRGPWTGSPPPTDPGTAGRSEPSLAGGDTGQSALFRQLQPDGSVRIPPAVLKHAGLVPGDLVEFVIDETGAVYLRRGQTQPDPAGEHAAPSACGAP